MQDAVEFYLEAAIDSFMDHNYGNALGFYWLFLHARGAQKCPSVAHFLQSPLLFMREGDQDVASFKTPWGTQYVGWPARYTEAEVERIASQLWKDCEQAAAGEGALLYMLLREPMVECECLRTEDPYDERFGKRPAQGTAKLTKKPRAYMLDCARCYKLPPGEESFPQCAKCRRVRYCGAECQKADWPRHKVECGKKRAEWWGRSSRVTRGELKRGGMVVD